MAQIKNKTKHEEEFLATVEKNKGIITKICYFYSKNQDEFKDLRQDVLASIWYSFDTFEGASNISTWIYRIALNTCLSSLRKRKRSGTYVGLENLPELASEDSDMVERNKFLYGLINSLKSEDKAIILLWLDELPYEEIASIIGLPRNTLATRIRRIKQQLTALARKQY